MDKLVGQYVIIRDHMAGVLAGTLDAIDLAAGTAVLTQARKIHYWQGAAAVEGLAARGPRVDASSATRITPAVEFAACRNVVQVILCTAEARAVIEGAPEWKP